MRRLVLFLLALLIVTPLAAGDWGNSQGFNISMRDDDGQITRCDQMHVRYDGERVPVTEEAVPVAGLRSLHIHASRNGGMRVYGTTDSGYSVTACKASIPGSDGARISVRGDEITTGESARDSVVFFIVRAPQNASLDLEARNGQISVQDVSGTITAHAQNGPVAIKNCSGAIDASTVNGPLAFSGNGGTVKLNARNGPIAVRLNGSSWGSGSLDARSENGPVALKMPRDFRSGVVVESDGHGPVSCHNDMCGDALRAARVSDYDDDRPRRIELGSGSAAVHIATVNGPIAISSSDRD